MAAVEAVNVDEVRDPERLRRVSDLFAEVWGRGEEGVPMHSEVLRSLVHAGGLVSVATAGDQLLGAAAVGRSRPGECYGYLAAVRPGHADRGVGRALKLHQRDWALAAGLTAMEWTFDPLGARNARFNLAKLGVRVAEYEVAFYGEMHDQQNAGEVGDRLVARWELDSAHVADAVAGRLPEPPPPRGEVLSLGPDRQPCAWQDEAHRWLRVPSDIMALRTADRAAGTAWRLTARTAFTAALADGWVADGFTRDGCYHFSRDPAGAHGAAGPQEEEQV